MPTSDSRGYVTDIPTTVMGAGEVVGKYHDLWHVERSFRLSKNTFHDRPMFHRRRDGIEAHLAIANIIKQLRPLR